MPLLFEGSIAENLGAAMSSTSLWTNIAKTILYIALGFFCIKKKLLPENTGKILTKFVMTISIPCLAFCSFMSRFTAQGAIDAVVNFILGFVFYIGFIFLGKLLFCWVKDEEKRVVLAVLFAFGSTTFFAYPIITAVYGSAAGNNFNVMNVAYRVFLYSYAYIVIANFVPKKSEGGDSVTTEKKKVDVKSMLKKIFLNSAVIATFAGLILWLLQGIPGINTIKDDPYTGAAIAANKGQLISGTAGAADAVYGVPFFRFDITLPWIFNAANTLGTLASPLILFAIGCTLGGTSVKEAVTDKYAWIWTGLKVIVAPGLVLGFLYAMEAVGKACSFPALVSMTTVNSAIITWMVPPATVAVGYCINFDRQKEMASHISLISTIGAIVGTILWVIVLTVISATGFFA